MTAALMPSIPPTVERAEAQLYEHLTATLGGRCVRCGDAHPCHAQDLAYLALAAYDDALPRRIGGWALNAIHRSWSGQR